MSIHHKIVENILRDNAGLIDKAINVFHLNDLDDGNKDEDDVADAVDWVFDQLVDSIPAALSPEDMGLARDELYDSITERLS